MIKSCGDIDRVFLTSSNVYQHKLISQGIGLLPFITFTFSMQQNENRSSKGPFVYHIVLYSTAILSRPRGLMDKASDFESEDSRFESWRGRPYF